MSTNTLKAKFWCGWIMASSFDLCKIIGVLWQSHWEKKAKEFDKKGCVIIMFRVPKKHDSEIIAHIERMLQDCYPEYADIETILT